MNMEIFVLAVIIAIGGFFLSGLRIIKQFERGVVLRLGKYESTRNPGLTWIIPFIDTLTHVDIRQDTISLKPQEVLSKDNVNLRIDGVVFFAIEQAADAILNVTDIETQLEAKATSELKEIIGSMDMQQALTQRASIASALMANVNRAIHEPSKSWGVRVRGIQINNIELPKDLVRAMAKTAEAEREKIARITKASGEFEASKKLVEAAKLYAGNPAAMRLRELQTYQEIGSEHNSLIIVAPERSDIYGLSALGRDILKK